MPVRYLKAVPETGRRMFVLLAEWLRSVCGATPVDYFPTPTWVTQSGSDGTMNASQPAQFVAASASFTGADVGRYLVTYGATQLPNDGLRKIVAVLSGTTVLVTSGLYGQPFATEVGVDWRIVDPTALDGAGAITYSVVNGEGTTPTWQLALTLGASPTATIGVQAQPLGNWNTGTHAATIGLTQTQHAADTTPKWYWRWDGARLIGWTVTNAGTGAYRILYAGLAQTFHSGSDPNCIVQTNAAPASLATTGSELLADNSTVGTMRFLVPTIAGTPVFPNATINPLDLRLDVGAIPFGSAAAQNELRGVLEGLVYVPSSRAYGTFVNNTRTVLSLGDGYGVAWDGALIV